MNRFIYYLTLQPLYRLWMRFLTPKQHRWMLNKRMTIDGRDFDIVRVKDSSTITIAYPKEPTK